MSIPVIYSIIESSSHPDFSQLYAELKLQVMQFRQMRRAMAELKRTSPDYVVAEFFYGYANNYAGVNISNLDVLLFSLQRYAPQAKVIVLVEKSEHKYVQQLNGIFPVRAVLTQPVQAEDLRTLFSAL
ncbi:MAG: hypothetical protein KZQ82_06340 [Candidatus Thiodiazotropha sp. (ex Lucinoma annulata)]|nr:hypothetical protein [Candidatus Thiodiazotropha sp. (ex Troendleina suluensis)]MCU7883804.1 hypothetical protein [Candidatus Thiodiazotropha sp. (ex Lucinoma annulata)]